MVGADYINHIWLPDTLFINEKVAYFHAAIQVPQKRKNKRKNYHFSKDKQFLRITHLGEILRSMRLTVEVSK